MEYLLYFWKKMLYSIKILTTSIQNFTLLPFSYFKRTPSFTSCADIINILIFPIQNDSLTKTEKTTNMNGRIFPLFNTLGVLIFCLLLSSIHSQTDRKSTSLNSSHVTSS